MSEERNDLVGRTKPQIDEATTGVRKPEGIGEWKFSADTS
jgi:hypothetical protein